MWHGRRVSEYRVDGLYLHGMSALMQGRAGELQLIPPLLEALINDPVLSGVALYAADVHPLEVRARFCTQAPWTVSHTQGQLLHRHAMLCLRTVTVRWS